METQWMPGPWAVEPETEGSGQWVCAPDGEYVATGYGRFNGDPSGKANAHLISAAPDLYAVAMEYEAWEADVILNADWTHDTPRLTQAQWDVLVRIQAKRNAALAKARGEA